MTISTDRDYKIPAIGENGLQYVAWRVPFVGDPRTFYSADLKGAVAVFLVRVFLFLMSRQSGDTGPLQRTGTPSASETGRRTAFMPPASAPVPHAPVAGDMFGEDRTAAKSDTVTREEMIKLFGGALRVR